MFNLYPGKGKFNLQEYNTKYYASRHFCHVQVGKAYTFIYIQTKHNKKEKEKTFRRRKD